MLMANHGALTYGDNLAAAVERDLLLEWVCTGYWQAAAVGTPRIWTPSSSMPSARSGPPSLRRRVVRWRPTMTASAAASPAGG